MRNIPDGKLVWSLKRYNLKENRLFEHITDFDGASVYRNQNNGEETLTITRWSQEQLRRRLQADE